MSDSIKWWTPVFMLAIAITHTGSLGREVIVWDESTFILMAASVLDGNLPYVELTNIKPPLLFFLLAGAMWALGESLFVVRLVGNVCILASSIAVFAIARRSATPETAALAGLMFIAISATSVSQYTSTELPATALLMLAFWALLAGNGALRTMAAAGILLSLAVLTRLNLGIAAAALGIWLLAGSFRPSLNINRRGIVVFVVAGLIPPALLTLLYWYAGALLELRVALIDLPLALPAGETGLVASLRTHFYSWYDKIRREPLIYGLFALATAAGMGYSAWSFWRRKRDGTGIAGADAELLWLMSGAILLSFFLGSSQPNHHYWLQLFPFGALFCAIAFDRWGQAWSNRQRLRAVARRAGYAVALACWAGVLWATVPGAVALAANPAHIAANHYAQKAARAIAADRQPGDDIWALRYHIILWYLDLKSIIAPLAQPSDAAKSYQTEVLSKAGLIPSDYWERLIAARPTYIVTDITHTDRVAWYFDEAQADAVRALLENHYSVFYDDGVIRIYKRRSGT